MPVYWLSDDIITFPNPESTDKEGLLAVGGDLSPKRLLMAYKMGIFPWYNPEEPILWWCPDPRLVLFPSELKVAKSMRTYFNQKKMSITLDHDFEHVMRNCKDHVRKSQEGSTWITEEIIDAYKKLHEMGYAHSVEVWQHGEIVAGIYGITIGKCFFGESMYSKVSNASKFGMISLTRLLGQRGFHFIDCQVYTSHLASLGARNIRRSEFLDILKRNEREKTDISSWKDWEH
ncbi:MAG: leucyl/phenylalanyl-tRNA--protein transferase [Saprospiraceae bacterium]|nr:leucyl/phenylalanyl-tRNA--protein transferase [Saprospiraceae bacterium]